MVMNALLDFITVNVLYEILLNKLTPCNLFTSSKKFACHIIHIEGYSSHYIIIEIYFLHLTLLLGMFINL